MTMPSGAIFFETEVEVEKDDESFSSSVEADVKNLNDATQDALMEQVVKATQRKRDLLQSVKDLNSTEKMDDTAKEIVATECDLAEFNIKPSMLRRLSHASQILHLENIAMMKKRRSQTISDTLSEGILMENDNDSSGGAEVDSGELNDVTQAASSKVSQLSEIFMARSKKHIKGHARRRTLDDLSYQHDEGECQISNKDKKDVTVSDQKQSPSSKDIEDESSAVSDLVQLHSQIIRDKSGEEENQQQQSRTLQRHQSFPSVKRLQAQSVYNDRAVEEKPSEAESNDAITTESQQTEKQRAFSFNHVMDRRNENLSASAIEFRKRASTDVDLRSVDKNGSSGS